MKALTALVDRLSGKMVLNGPLRVKTDSFTLDFSLFKANSANPDQTPRSAASDLGLHCLPMS